MHLNRVVAILTTILSLAVGLLPVIANFDWTSTAGVLGSLAVVGGVVLKWLDGWQKHEARDALVVLPVPPEPDQGDAGAP